MSPNIATLVNSVDATKAARTTAIAVNEQAKDSAALAKAKYAATYQDYLDADANYTNAVKLLHAGIDGDYPTLPPTGDSVPQATPVTNTPAAAADPAPAASSDPAPDTTTTPIAVAADAAQASTPSS